MGAFSPWPSSHDQLLKDFKVVLNNLKYQHQKNEKKKKSFILCFYGAEYSFPQSVGACSSLLAIVSLTPFLPSFFWFQENKTALCSRLSHFYGGPGINFGGQIQVLRPTAVFSQEAETTPHLSPRLCKMGLRGLGPILPRRLRGRRKQNLVETWGKLEPRLPSSLQKMGYLWPPFFWRLSLFGEHFASSKLKFMRSAANPIKATVRSSLPL